MSAGFFQLENIVVEGYRDDANDPIKKEVFSNIYEKMIYIVLSRHGNANSSGLSLLNGIQNDSSASSIASI